MQKDAEISVQSQMIDLPDGRFHYLSWGAEHTERPPAVLLHGITSSALSWVRVGPALAEHYRVYALDMRGHGKSIKPSAGAYSLRNTADDALAFIKALGLDRPVLVGHSWGGATAIVLASGAWSQEPVPALASLILEDPAHNFGQEGDPETRAAFYIKDIGRPAPELRVEIAASSPGWTEADIEGKVEALQQVTREAVISVFAEASSGSILPFLANMTVPTLLLRADSDMGTTLTDSAWKQAQQSLPPRSRAVQINEASHNIHRSKFDPFMQEVNSFLQEETDAS